MDLQQWFPMPELPIPILFEYKILVKHKYGIDAVYFSGVWRFWYSGDPLTQDQTDDIFKTATHYMAVNKI